MKLEVGNLSPGLQKVLLIVPPIIIIAVAVFVFILPAKDDMDRLDLDIQKQLSDIKVAQQKTATLPELVKENERLKSLLKEQQIQLPEEKEVSGLLKQVSEMGIKAGLQVVSWKPGPKSVHASQEIYEIPVDVEMLGTYHKFGEFFSAVTGLNRIVTLANINMKLHSYRRNDTQLNLVLKTMTYSIIPEAERKAMQQKQQPQQPKQQKPAGGTE